MQNRLFGVQVDELPAGLASSPVAFAEWSRARRCAAGSAAKALFDGSSRLSDADVRELLVEHGLSVLGSVGERRQRLA